jgi:hypothetical protein
MARTAEGSATNRAGRIIGILIIPQMVGSSIVNFGLLKASPDSRQVGLAVLLGLLTTLMLVGVAITAFPILWQHSRALPLWILSLAVVSLGITAVENIGLLSSAAFRDWAHYMAKIFDGATNFVFYAALYRSALVPRVLAVFGLIAAPLMIASLALPFFGHDVVFPLLAPMGLCQVILALWLLARGFRDQ